MSEWKALGAAAALRDRAGRRRLTVVVGSGFNQQAGLRDSWLSLLEGVARDAPIEPGAKAQLKRTLAQTQGSGMTSIWEAFLCALAGPKRAPHDIEGALKRKVASALRASHEAQAPGLEFYREFAAHDFSDLISLNFDRSLLIANGRPEVAGKTSLDRHGSAGRSRVWFPHGDTQEHRSIRLGVRSYGTYIEALEQARRGYQGRQRRQRGRGSELVHPPKSWLDVVLDNPVLFVGCGLSSDEWPLWWVLHQRARNHARRERLFARQAAGASPAGRPGSCFVMWAGDVPEHLKAKPAGIRLVHAKHHGSCWSRLRKILRETA